MRAERRRGASVEDVVAGLVAELRPVAGTDPSPDARLMDLGLDSLACADVAVALEHRFGVRLADNDVTGHSTIAEVAATVRREMPAGRRIPVGLGRHQRLGKMVAGPVLRWLLRMQVTGIEHVPSTGPVILAANHRSFWDIPVHVIASPRPIAFMAKQELYKGPITRWLWRSLGGFPVRRETADIRAIDTALALLERGDVVGVYPEGTRSRTGEMLPFLKGAAWLALRTGAPIVPCGLKGTERRRGGKRRGLRRRVRVSFGPSIHVNGEPDARVRREKADALTDQLLLAIQELLA
ncbi:MAG TPA: 1-acyl-sn-glycerol-3-phosphate acyltransferase [Actinomycetota bacterium]|nr:1-acyl-sn-glycerol-3-phosphate acyltransferase [Actinomycetota bacterium]